MGFEWIYLKFSSTDWDKECILVVSHLDIYLKTNFINLRVSGVTRRKNDIIYLNLQMPFLNFFYKIIKYLFIVIFFVRNLKRLLTFPFDKWLSIGFGVIDDDFEVNTQLCKLSYICFY